MSLRGKTDRSVTTSAGAAEMTVRARFIEVVERGGGSRLVARRLACSRSYVDMLRAGSRRPGMRVAHAIEREFGIPMQAWLDDAREGA